ncbi:MAG: TniQ family protein, partial [Anaerolineae bacterium]|nr:TniQ family protein [Anaerolineae bacterium]
MTMNGVIPLLNRRPLLPGESLLSLLHRLQEANYYPLPNMLHTICQPYMKNPGDKLHRPREADTYQVLAALARLTPAELYQATSHRFAPTLTFPGETSEHISLGTQDRLPLLAEKCLVKYLWQSRDVQYCPLCLAEACYHRVEWLLMPVAACLRHACVLQRRCPHCLRSLAIEALFDGRCPHCKFILMNTPVTSLANDEWGLTSQAIIQNWFGLADAPMWPGGEIIPAQPTSARFYLLHGLSRGISSLPATLKWHVPPGNLTFPLNSSKAFLFPAQVYVLYAAAMKAVADWPDGFYAFLDEVRQANGRTGQLQQELGPVYVYWLERGWRHAAFQFVQTAFDDYLVNHFPLTPSVLHSRRYQETPGLAARFPFMPVAEAARSLQTTPAIVERLVRREMLVAYQPDKGKRRSPKKTGRTSLKLVGRAGVLELRARWETAVPLADAATVLGLSKSVVLDLVEIGVLMAVRGPAVDETNSWQLAQESITGLVEQIEARARHYYDRDSTPVNLTYAAQVLSPYGYKVAGVIQLMLDDKIRCYWGWGHGRQLADLRLMVPDLTAVLEDLKTRRPFVTRRHIAEQMGVKPYIVGRWVKHGLIEQEYRRGVGWYFSREVAEG